ncbi:hypothetical protein SAMN05428988_4179 [Chitinophaga sp. YR573]|uniref:hypothetical protein n=1 Tax=Chitinophaga sp. YR573 TaxID=1881040 RepID=UPI0008C11098|nr:hypothetical protein [Chitinophaga sp. YR573]SEW34647.1 hypothetical protein SAMN05428988_4179 [Chitinophaga sp. YR573]
MELPPISFGPGFVENANIVRVICHIGEGADTVTTVARWDGLENKWGLFPMKWIPVAQAMLDLPHPCYFTLSTNGTVGFGYGDYHEEQIDDIRGPMRDLRAIDNQLYATGMGRQVYRKEPDGSWLRIDEGVVVPKGEISPSGFSSIDGTSGEDIWAVGMLGEIWHFDGNQWTKHESPVKVMLNRVVAVDPDLVYVVGQKGVVLKYNRNRWSVLYNTPDIGDLWDAEWYLDALYVASEKNIYRLLDNNCLKPVSTTAASSFGHLHAKDGVLWSFGTGHLAFTSDGETWNAAKPLL